MRVTQRSFGASTGLLFGALISILAGCASAPPAKPGAGGAVIAQDGRDGAEAQPPKGLENVADAEPRVEAIRVGGPNKPYEALGREYVPFTQDRPYSERGLASWYGRRFHGKRTSSGEPYDMYAMTAAHPTLPIPSYARVRNPANGREVVVRVNDRGPFHPGRVIDLSYTAALKLDVLRGVAPVEVERITFDEIRAGTWRRGVGADGLRLAAADAGDVAARSAAGAPMPTATVPATSPADAGRPALAGPPTSAPAPELPGAVPAPTSNLAQPTSSSQVAPTSSPPIGPTSSPQVGTTSNAEVAGASSPVPSARDGAARLVQQAPAAGSAEFAVAAASDARVRMVPDAASTAIAATPARGFWVQLGAFRQRGGATAFQQRVAAELDWLSPLLAVVADARLFRLQAGPYPDRDQALGAAEIIRAALQLVPVIVERR